MGRNKYSVKHTVLQYMVGNADRLITLKELYELMPGTSHSVISTTCGQLVQTYPNNMKRVDHGVYQWETEEGRQAHVVINKGGTDVVITSTETPEQVKQRAADLINRVHAASDKVAAAVEANPIVTATVPETLPAPEPKPEPKPANSMTITVLEVDGDDYLVRGTDDGRLYIMTPLDWKKAR